MAKYRIVSARPKNASNHLKSEFKVFELRTSNGKVSWWGPDWRTIYDIVTLMAAGNEVRTSKLEGGKMKHGAAVELELRISSNGTEYGIDEMPDV